MMNVVASVGSRVIRRFPSFLTPSVFVDNQRRRLIYLCRLVAMYLTPLPKARAMLLSLVGPIVDERKRAWDAKEELPVSRIIYSEDGPPD